MAFEYPAGHILSAGGYQPPSERPARAGATRQVATGAEPPQFIAGLAGTRAEPQVTQAGFGALIPLAIGAAARYLPPALPWIGGANPGAGPGGGPRGGKGPSRAPA